MFICKNSTKKLPAYTVNLLIGSKGENMGGIDYYFYSILFLLQHGMHILSF